MLSDNGFKLKLSWHFDDPVTRVNMLSVDNP